MKTCWNKKKKSWKLLKKSNKRIQMKICHWELTYCKNISMSIKKQSILSLDKYHLLKINSQESVKKNNSEKKELLLRLPKKLNMSNMRIWNMQLMMPRQMKMHKKISLKLSKENWINYKQDLQKLLKNYRKFKLLRNFWKHCQLHTKQLSMLLKLSIMSVDVLKKKQDKSNSKNKEMRSSMVLTKISNCSILPRRTSLRELKISQRPWLISRKRSIILKNTEWVPFRNLLPVIPRQEIKQ